MGNCILSTKAKKYLFQKTTTNLFKKLMKSWSKCFCSTPSLMAFGAAQRRAPYLWDIFSHLIILIQMDIFLVGAECEIGALLGTVLETLIGSVLA